MDGQAMQDLEQSERDHPIIEECGFSKQQLEWLAREEIQYTGKEHRRALDPVLYAYLPLPDESLGLDANE